MSSYLDFYELKRHPFEIEGAGVVLATRPVRKVLAFIRQGLAEDAPALCVTGRAGVGRSSLARALPATLRELARTAWVDDPTRPWSELRASIAKQLIVSIDGSEGPELTDGAFPPQLLVGARSLGHRLVLVIDDANQATVEVIGRLDALLRLRGPAGERLIQAVLLARADDEASPFSRWRERRRVLHTELEPLPPGEIHGYIGKRLETAGRKNGLFTETASLLVHRHSHGIPRRVNEACDAVLRASVGRSLERIDGRDVTAALN